MTKMIPATCTGGVVMADGVPLPTAEILSAGVGQSQGIALLDESDAAYIANTTPDLQTTLEKIIDALAQVKTALDSIGDGLTQASTGITTTAGAPGGTTVGGAAVASVVNAIVSDVASVTTAAVSIELAKTALEALKGALQ